MTLPLFANRRSLFKSAVPAFALVMCLVSMLMPRVSQAQNTISTFAGGGSFIPPGGAPTSLDLPGPTAAIRDASGANTFIAAPYSTYVVQVNNGAASIFAGVGYSGNTGDNGPANQAALGLPTALAFDSQGNVYIADPKASRIRKVTISTGTITGTITTVAGCDPQCSKPGGKCVHPYDPCGDGGPATGPNALLNLPLGIAVDKNNVLYIADAYDNRIRAVNLSSVSVTVYTVTIAPGNIATVAGKVSGPSNQCPNPINACGDGGPALSAELNYPQGVAFDSAGSLYIADTRDERIRIVTADGNINKKVGAGRICKVPTGPCGDGGAYVNANLTMPMAVVLDASNNIYIADTLDNKVRVANTQSGPITVFGVTVKSGNIGTIAGTGTPGYNGDNKPATTAELNVPNGLFLDSTGNMLVSDTGNQLVRQIVAAGTISSFAGGGLGNDGGPAANAILENPYNVAEDSLGNVFIVDSSNNRIRAVNTQGSQIVIYGVTIGAGDIATVAGTGITGATGDGGPGTQATLNGPMAIAFDSANNMFISDTGNEVIRKLDRNTGTITRYAGQYAMVCPGGTPQLYACGDTQAATTATFNTPEGIAVDSLGNLYIADYNDLVVRQVTAAGIISTIAGDGKATPACSTTPAPALSVGIFHPSSVSVDNAGNVYIDNTYGNMICRESGGMVSDYALNGLPGYSGDGGPALNASEFFPLWSTIDPSGNVFLGGGDFSCIRRVDAVTYTIGTVVGNPNGTPKCAAGFLGDSGLATLAEISNAGFSVDANSNLYIADEGNNRVRLVHLSPAITTTPPPNFGAWQIGQTSTPENLTITSSGGVDLTLSALGPLGGTNPGDFQVTGQTCTAPDNLGVDQSCTVTFTFTPQALGLRNATYPITDNAPNSPQTITLSGYGPYFTITASPATLTIPRGTQKVSTLTIAPQAGFTGTVNLSITGCTVQNGLTCTLDSNQVTLNGTSVTDNLTVTASSTATVGTDQVTVKGTSGQLQFWANIRVTVQ